MGKIGVVTLFHVRNIGAVLQAYATNKILTEAGYEVEYIRCYGIRDSLSFFLGDIGGIRLYNLKFVLNKIFKFEKAFKLFTEVKLNQINTTKYEAIIFGSDSIWIPRNQKESMPPAFFGMIRNDNKLAYAASSGGYDDLNKFTSEQKKAIVTIDHISVRDVVTKKLVNKLTKKPVNIVLDPTLLINWNTYLQENTCMEKIEKEDYIMLYGGFKDKDIKKLKEYAREKNKKLIAVGSYIKGADKSIAVSPIEFLNYVKYADEIYTSMFHGVMISISFNKQFSYFSADPNRDKKLETVLYNLGLQYLLINSGKIFLEEIDYSVVNKRLEEQRIESLDFLLNSIKNNIVEE